MAGKISKKRVTLQFHAPDAEEIYLAGSFNGWNPSERPLKRHRDGNWKTTLTLEPGTYEYLFVVDGSWVSDPQCVNRIQNNLGSHNCLLHV